MHLHACIHFTYTQLHAHTFTNLHLHPYMYTHAPHIYSYTYTCTHFYIVAHIHAHTHTCTHTHGEAESRRGTRHGPSVPLMDPAPRHLNQEVTGRIYKKGPPGGGAADSESHLPPFASHIPALNTFFFFNHLSGERVARDLWGQLRQFCKMTL